MTSSIAEYRSSEACTANRPLGESMEIPIYGIYNTCIYMCEVSMIDIYNRVPCIIRIIYTYHNIVCMITCMHHITYTQCNIQHIHYKCIPFLAKL